MTEAGAESGRSEALPFPPALGCLFSVLVGLAGVAVLFLTLSFALRGEVRFASGDLTERRVWLIREDGQVGFGMSTASIVSGSEASGQTCVETRVRFLMLRGDGAAEPVEYCECLDRVDGSWFSSGSCEP